MMRWTTNPLLRGSKEPNWLHLPHDLTFTIISRLGAFQILTSSAQRVCRQWRSICKDPLMWRTINMCDIGIYNSVDFKLEEMCRYAIDRSCGLLEDISIKYFGSNDLLKYIADSQCQLRRLRLVLCFGGISDEGLVEIAERLPMLEELDITLCRNVSSVALEAIGRACPLLKSFKYNDNHHYYRYYVPNVEAFAIAQNMPNLRHLQLVNNNLDNSGVTAILEGCPRLESLDLRQCRNVKLKKKLRRRCDEQLKKFIEPDTSVRFDGYEFGLFYDSHYDDLAFGYGSEKKMFPGFIEPDIALYGGFCGYDVGLYYESDYDDLEFDYKSKKKMFRGFANNETAQGDGEEEEGAATANWEEIYGIWECAKNQRSPKAFKRYLTEKEKKKKKDDKSKGKKKHRRKERQLIRTK